MTWTPTEEGEADRIPPFTFEGLLPPQRRPTGPLNPCRTMSPYLCSQADFVRRFGFSDERRALLRQFFAWRAAIYARGFLDGSQVIGGSFVDDCEKRYGRPPKDIDVLTILGPAPKLRTKAFDALFEDLHGKAATERFGVNAWVVSPSFQSPVYAVTVASSFTQMLTRDRRFRQRGVLLLPFDRNMDRLTLEALNA